MLREKAKADLCHELKTLVQTDAERQFKRLAELTERLEKLTVPAAAAEEEKEAGVAANVPPQDNPDGSDAMRDARATVDEQNKPEAAAAAAAAATTTTTPAAAVAPAPQPSEKKTPPPKAKKKVAAGAGSTATTTIATTTTISHQQRQPDPKTRRVQQQLPSGKEFTGF